MFIISIPIKNIEINDLTVFSSFKTNLKSVIIIISSIIVLISFILKRKNINRINTTFILILIFLIVNPINDIVENLSVYKFVCNRFFTCYLYSIIMLGFIYWSYFLSKHIKKNIVIVFLYIILSIFLTCFSLHSSNNQYGYNKVLQSYKILFKNPYIFPNSIKKMGEVLEEIYQKEKKQLNVLVPDTLIIDDYNTAVSSVLRTYAPHSSVITAISRFGVAKNNIFGDYKAEYTSYYYNFIYRTNEQNYLTFKKVFEKYPINCIITTSFEPKKYLELMGFKLYYFFSDDDNDYYIFYTSKVET